MTSGADAAPRTVDEGPSVPAGRVATPVAFGEEDLDEVSFGADGLVPAVVQDATDGTVLMLGYMDREALRRTLDTGRTWFWSRSRQEYWCKGETSGDRQWVRAVHYDCDGDALLGGRRPGRQGRMPHGAAQLLLPRLRRRGRCRRRRSPAVRPAPQGQRPGRDAFGELARHHRVVPVWRELVADTVTPVGAFMQVVGEQPGFLLESVEGGERWGRYSFVGRRALATMVARRRARGRHRRPRPPRGRGRDRRRDPGHRRGVARLLPLTDFGRPAAPARGPRRLHRLRRGARGRAPARCATRRPRAPRRRAQRDRAAVCLRPLAPTGGARRQRRRARGLERRRGRRRLRGGR